MEKHDEISKLLNDFKALTIDSEDVEAILEERYKEFTDNKLRFNSLTPSRFTNDRYQETLDLIHKIELRFQLYRLLLNFTTVQFETGGAKAKLEDMHKEFTDLKSRFNSLTLKGSSHVQQILDAIQKTELCFEYYQFKALMIKALNNITALRFAGCDTATLLELSKEFQDLNFSFKEYQGMLDGIYKLKSKFHLLLVKAEQEQEI